jgi:DNA-binding HxlR family transcriptional regulator
MRRASFEHMNCSIARSLEIIGEWWTLLILRDAFLGVTRFEDFQHRLGIARNILATRLDTLVAAGVMERRPYDQARERYDYQLTDMGRALWPVMVTLRQWGDEWVVGQGNEPIALLHTGCGTTTTGHLVCDHCGDELTRDDVRAVAGPGLKDSDLLSHGRR